jgi:hypothetical protein
MSLQCLCSLLPGAWNTVGLTVARPANVVIPSTSCRIELSKMPRTATISCTSLLAVLLYTQPLILTACGVLCAVCYGVVLYTTLPVTDGLTAISAVAAVAAADAAAAALHRCRFGSMSSPVRWRLPLPLAFRPLVFL